MLQAAGRGVWRMSPPRLPCCRRLYDCDFNQQLDLGLRNEQHRTVFDIDSLEELTGEGTILLWRSAGARGPAGLHCCAAVVRFRSCAASRCNVCCNRHAASHLFHRWADRGGQPLLWVHCGCRQRLPRCHVLRVPILTSPAERSRTPGSQPVCPSLLLARLTGQGWLSPTPACP